MSNSDEEGLAYWLRWQVPVCAVIILLPASLILRVTKNIKAEPLYFGDLWKSCWRRLSPAWLLLYRALAFLCLTFIFVEAVALDGAFAFYFYTQ